MKKYNKPNLEVFKINTIDVITTSDSPTNNFVQNISTGALTADSISSAGKMGDDTTYSGSLSTLRLINNANPGVSSYKKAYTKFDLLSEAGRKVIDAKLTLNMKYQGNTEGNLYIYGIENAASYTDAASFVSTYNNWSALSGIVSLVNTYNRPLGYLNEYAGNIVIDVMVV